MGVGLRSGGHILVTKSVQRARDELVGRHQVSDPESRPRAQAEQFTSIPSFASRLAELERLVEKLCGFARPFHMEEREAEKPVRAYLLLRCTRLECGRQVTSFRCSRTLPILGSR